MSAVYDRVQDLPDGFVLAALPPRAACPRALMVTPDSFEVVAVHNPHMEGQVGHVDPAAARAEWESLRTQLERGLPEGVAVLEATPDLPDMVFCQNQALVGRDASGARLGVVSHMLHESRRAEVPPVRDFFTAQGYRMVDVVPPGVPFEGGGDATWHPGRRLLWGGHGPRTAPDAYPPIAEAFGVPVLRLNLIDPRFYHLDTCFRPLDEHTVMLYPDAFDAAGQELIAAVFPSVVPVQEDDAAGSLALNGVPMPGRKYVLHKGSAATCAFLRALGYSVSELNLGEFLRSGASAYCMVHLFEPA